MTPSQATEIGKRIVNTMRPTPALAEWQEVLEPLDFDAALRTFRDLRDRVDDGLRIATFHVAYGTARGGTSRRRGKTPDPYCLQCRGCGWADGPTEYETVNGEPHPYTTVIPCTCGREP